MGSERSPLEPSRQTFSRSDDLTRIQGIGPVIERQLYDAGIVTYAQLAALSPEQIALLIKNLPLLSVERIARQNWPGQARVLAAEAASTNLGGPAEAFDPPSRYATFTIELLIDDAGQVHRTHVLHDQDGEAATWDGWDEDHLLRFLTAHATVKAALHLPEAVPQVIPGSFGIPGRFVLPDGIHDSAEDLPTNQRADRAFDGAQLEIRFVRVDEVAAPHQRAASPVVPIVQAQLSFRIAGLAADCVVADAAHCVVHLMAYDLSSGAAIALATGHSRLVANQLEYASTLEFALPEDGRYQLVGLVWIAQARLVGSALGPVLRVVP